MSDTWLSLIGDTCHNLVSLLVSSLTRVVLHMSLLTRVGPLMSLLTRTNV